MKQPEHRKFIRYDALHLLDYLVLGEDGEAGIYSMGRTLDVSLDGIKLETIYPLQTGTHLLITLGIEEDLVNLEGRTVYSLFKDNRYQSGINFLKINKNDRRVLTVYIAAFEQHKEGLTKKQPELSQVVNPPR